MLGTSQPSLTLFLYAASLPPGSLGGKRTACPVPASLLIALMDFLRVQGKRRGGKGVCQLMLTGGGRVAVFDGVGAGAVDVAVDQ
jgi:hypothetical protein